LELKTRESIVLENNFLQNRVKKLKKQSKYGIFYYNLEKQ